MPFEYECTYCKKTFSRKERKKSDSDNVFCSRTCYHKHQKIYDELTCLNCGKTFKPIKGKIKGKNRKFCSRKCYDEYHKGIKVEKICPVCGKTFSVYKSVENRYTVCSTECRHKYTKYVKCERCGKLFRAEKRLNRHYCSEECRRPPIIIKCKNCGKPFRKRPSEDAVFCSRHCFVSYRGESRLEQKIRETLESMNIPFKQEMKIGNYRVDFALLSKKIVIEVDSKYWHMDKNKDMRKDKYLNKYGWEVIRINDYEIYNSNNLTYLVNEKILHLLH